ncbi:MAG: phage tail protein [Rhodobacteraceae bacterium]|nr:phage tail protein [Paracoccaceae bacterium]|tara:strand:+ start:5454 stop:5876 length:423 start_codon:yes stop_codon:yes gene_type:complete
MSWSDRYLGLPYADLGRTRAGCDCYGLVRLVYAEQLGIELPSYAGDYVGAAEQAEVSALLDREEAVGPWRPVEDAILPFDLLLFRRGRLRSHVGVAVAVNLMLHMDGEAQARIARLSEPRWRSRFAGAFRHAEALLKAPA